MKSLLVATTALALMTGVAAADGKLDFDAVAAQQLAALCSAHPEIGACNKNMPTDAARDPRVAAGVALEDHALALCEAVAMVFDDPSILTSVPRTNATIEACKRQVASTPHDKLESYILGLCRRTNDFTGCASDLNSDKSRRNQ